ncbi:zf-HC2 domain-containing protein [Microbacterium sp. B2969]|uniref:Zf-HC2 domain-containing protein n=1 Tax=Microbacterium alkaliflavum TaxID=3248839 RepID=A0ABW7Q6K0_9MICO
MNPDHPRFAQWDAAYVLGALSPAERREFEAHLEMCPDCRHAIAQLAPTVGLLSRISAEDAVRIDAVPPPAEEPDHPAEVLSLARERAHRRRRSRIIGLAVAAVLVIVALAVPFAVTGVRPPAQTFALESVVETPLQAGVRLTSVAWGTRIDLNCRYPEEDDADGPVWTYALAVVGADGTAQTVSTWKAGPGSTARLSAGTALDVADIRAVEIRTASGTVLMSYDLPAATSG